MEIINYRGNFVFGGMQQLFYGDEGKSLPSDYHFHYVLEINLLSSTITLTLYDSKESIFDVYNNIVDRKIIKEILSILYVSLLNNGYEYANGFYCDFLPQEHNFKFDKGNMQLSFETENRFPNNKRLQLLIKQSLTNHINKTATLNFEDLFF